MPRYIDANAALDNLRNDLPFKASVKRVLMQAPTADVVEVVHATWKWGKENGQYGYYCTKCRAGFVNSENAEWIAKSHDYCPKCGAKMDGEGREK